jgi:cytochrome c oxidase cbb3-type subunit 2
MNSPAKKQNEFAGWQGIGLIAITYIYFLIFAQFGFLKRLAELGIAADQLKPIMGALALGGGGTSLLAVRLENFREPVRRLQLALAGCAAGAVITLLPLNLAGALGTSFLIGASLGVLTVTLVTHLKQWLGASLPLLKVGAGVGLAYFICNYPALFDASPGTMAVVSAALCLAGVGIAVVNVQPSESPVESARPAAFLLVLACFTALVWLDSAAFFIIQNTPVLKAGTWEGSRRLWQNGGVHLIAALVSAGLLQRFGLRATLAVAFTFLGGACLLLAEPARAALASLAYPIGVSLYSVALVAYPAFLANRTSPKERARLAGWLYAVAGWIGSGLGIGMGENLRHIPSQFVLAAAVLIFTPLLWKAFRQRQREGLTVLVLFGTAWILSRCVAPASPIGTPLSPIEKGRDVYLAEGCIHCHSQFVRPGSPDEMMWGTPTDVAASRAEQPPLIGNRRQGPDLATVGNRRSALWLKAHFISPRTVSYLSPMPSYAYLFNDERGDDLVAYVGSLGASQLVDRLTIQSVWQPHPTAGHDQLDGAKLVQQYCLTCHSAAGAMRQNWGKGFKRLPPDFKLGPFNYAPAAADIKWRQDRITQIIKFGLPGTDMPGHEYLGDDEIAAMAEHVASLSEAKQP